MPQNYSGRVTLILVILLGAICLIFPPMRWFNQQPFSQKLNLKPGIDMVGGTSLLYEIKAPGGAGEYNGKLAEQVMEALKHRVDPNGVRNLIWRPQGSNRLEIQMPLSADTAGAKKIRDDYTQARNRLAATNVRETEVLSAVERQSGAAQDKRLVELAMGSQTRLALFRNLAKVYGQIKAAEKASDVRSQAINEEMYEKLTGQIVQTNIDIGDLDSALADKPEVRNAKLAELKKQYADFPERVAAIDQYATAFDAFAKVKNSIDDAGELKRLLRGSGVLEFHILVTGDEMNSPEAQEMINRLKPGGKGPGVQSNDMMRWYQVDRPEDAQSLQVYPYNGKQWALAWTTPEKEMVNGPGIKRWALEAAYQAQADMGVRAVGFRFNAQGAKYFGELTANNLKRLMAVMLDDKIISAATIQSVISSEGVISRGDGYSDSEFNYLISTLSAGSLPAQLAEEPIMERTIEPQLGAENLRAGLIACGFGLVIVAIFLIVYYYMAGLVATLAVMMNVILILGSMAAMNATFTLPSIAGIVLAIGAAVDANVLIFERLREEQHRGLSLRMALHNAYDRAFSAILDSNVTTLITALILYGLGSEEVKGFGLTLLIGLAWSMFTALFVTKTIFAIMSDKFGMQHLGSLPLSFPKWDKMLQPKIDWMGKAWIFMVFSGVLMVAGLAAFVAKARHGEIMAIDFAGGTSVQFELLEPLPKAEVVKALAKQDALPDLSVQKLGSAQKEYEILTPNMDSPKVQDAVLNALKGKLKLEQPSSFEGAADPIKPVDSVIGTVVLPIENDLFKVGNFNPPGAASHVGGAAIVLKNLNPALSPRQIKTRIERQQLQPQPGEAIQSYREFDVQAESGPDKPTNTAVVLVSDPNLSYDQDRVKWQEGLASPMWKLVNEAVNRPPQLQKVSNFGPQVASDTTNAALLALFLSLLVIMAYIWLRFGNLLYGTATIAAMLHDTLLVLGLLGLSHYMADTAIGRALLVDTGFRIDLTMVAAILTVMSYSMIDTIVVFDRVRENRGKFGHLSREVVNDSINQTLSRTILTGSTNIFTVLVMYVSGGPGIHGFTFILLVGILIGTYSSVAIAAPMLLIGAKKKLAGEGKQAPIKTGQKLGA